MTSFPVKDRLAAVGSRAVARPTDVQIERHLEFLSQWMDNKFQIPVLGWRFGLNAVIDLVPSFGDIATSVVATYILISAVRYRVSKITLLRMAVNIAIYFVIGLVPWAGDLVDAWWKPNIRNLNLLRQRATVSGEALAKGRTSDWMFVGGIIVFLFLMLFGSIAVTILILRFLANNIY